MGEFDLISKYFTRPVKRATLGVGDDCALFAPAPGLQIATSSDMLVEGRHFYADVSPRLLGHKSLAVNLSDLAACGAKPLAFTLALSLPRIDEGFLSGFSQGLFALADAHGCELIGGDTTQGPLNICVTIFGEVPAGSALLRSGAKPGDDLYVSGAVGDARLALLHFEKKVALAADVFARVRPALEQPQPRVALGLALRGIATSAIDVSDGLVGDLGHILKRARVGATVEVDAVPRSAALAAQSLALQRDCTLAGGDDYELLFTAPAALAAEVHDAARSAQTPVTRIGRIEDGAVGLKLVDAQGAAVAHTFGSFDHFRA